MDIAKVIEYLNFKPKEGSQGEYFKVFEQHDNYKIYLDINNQNIDYGNRILAEDSTTSNFSKDENFVVLECVIRLLECGYSPDNIILEKTWRVGRDNKGKLDILVTRKSDDSPYLMIECKTWGDEFEKEIRKMLKNGGQLFSYYQLDRSADYLCLYSSKLSQNIEYVNSIIKIEDDWRHLSNQEELFNHWNKNFKQSGIFEEGVFPYGIKSKSLCRKDLIVLTKDDSSKIFNQFAQILRQNIISDKPNAFNKIFNLFLCKIVDEDKSPNEELEFQWLESDDYKTLQKRLNDLYKQGMKLFFNKTITDISDEELNEIFFNLTDSVELNILREKITDLRLQKNPEFAFKEVYDDKSFIDNGKVVKEIVELLQPYQLRYTHKHQFLGDFFERLLTTGLKQEAGQFFTPVPLSQFIINCLPLENIINENLNNNNEILPYVIDYAAGSGHFLTESMDELQKIIDNVDTDNVKESFKNKINAWKLTPYDWAEKYIYGIEADYRLIKTSKINCFLNGDGTAQLIHGDGLDNFYYSETYTNRLKLNNPDSIDNSNFDILVTNPPYSVQAFRNTLPYGDRTFELFKNLSENSKEIECLFVERAKQLLRIGGCAAIILPISFLSDGGIYFEARKIILKYFDIKTILILGNSAFMATKIKTIVLFLERKNNNVHERISRHITDFFDSPRDFTVNGIEEAFSKYVEDVFDNCNLEDYISLIKEDPNNNISQEYIFKGYKSKFGENELDFQEIIEIEKEKMFCYFLSYSQTVLTINPGDDTRDLKNFLGYSFKTKKGKKHINYDEDENGLIITPLFDPNNKNNPKKVNFYVKKMFEGETLDIDDSFEDIMNYINLNDLIDFKNINFVASINQDLTPTINWEDVWEDSNLKYLKDIAIIERGTSITEAETEDGNIPVVAGGKTSPYSHNVSNRDANVITVSASGKNAGYLNYWNEPIFASDCSTIISKNEEVISTLDLYNHLKEIQRYICKLQKGQAQEHVYVNDLEKIKFPTKYLNSK